MRKCRQHEGRLFRIVLPQNGLEPWILLAPKRARIKRNEHRPDVVGKITTVQTRLHSRARQRYSASDLYHLVWALQAFQIFGVSKEDKTLRCPHVRVFVCTVHSGANPGFGRRTDSLVGKSILERGDFNCDVGEEFLVGGGVVRPPPWVRLHLIPGEGVTHRSCHLRCRVGEQQFRSVCLAF